MRLLPLLVLLLGCPSEAPSGPCAAAVDGEPRVELGELAGSVYAPLDSGDELMVHAGLEGGFHSDLAVRLWGAGADADRPAGLTISAELDAPWDEESVFDLAPVCHDLDEPALLHTARYFYRGPPCGEDPCTGPDDQGPECVDHRRCVELQKLGFADLDWEEVYGLTASFDVAVNEDGFDASTAVSPVPLIQGFQVSGGG